MRPATLLALLAPLTALASAAEVSTDYTLTHVCTRKTAKGDKIRVHYRGTLASDGSEFDASYNRGDPLAFTVGQGQVIKGWDNGLLDMCPGDKRVLTIPPEFGYGARGVGPIPGGATLIFETELVEIVGAKKEPLVVADKASEPEPQAEETADTTDAADVPVETAKEKEEL